jgi:hypothetical protein
MTTCRSSPTTDEMGRVDAYFWSRGTRSRGPARVGSLRALLGFAGASQTRNLLGPTHVESVARCLL